MMQDLNENSAYQEAAKNWEGGFLFVIEPGGTLDHPVQLYMDLYHGKCRDAYAVTDGNPVKAAFYLSGPVAVWKKVMTRQLDPIQAMMTGKLKLVGNMGTVMRNVRAAKELVEKRVIQALAPTGMEVEVYSAVEPEPALETARCGAEAMLRFRPDWIIALGGGSVMDAAKAIWVLYERPDLSPEAINPIEKLGLRQKARLAAIPTTSGTGSEATWAIVLTDRQAQRKLTLGSRENLPDLAVLDPELVRELPARLTADTGLDALVHAVEGYTTTWHNDFSDGLCLKAAQLVFEYLPRACADGSDLDAREHLQNAAAIAGLGFGNAMAGLAHGLGHALGAVFHVPHGRAVALFLPYTIEYCANAPAAPTRYAGLARALGLPAASEAEAASALSAAIRDLERRVGQPLTLADCGIGREELEAQLDLVVENALNVSQTIMATRNPGGEELKRLMLAAYEGKKIEF